MNFKQWISNREIQKANYEKWISKSKIQKVNFKSEFQKVSFEKWVLKSDFQKVNFQKKRATDVFRWLNIGGELNNIKNGISLRFFSVSELKFSMEGGNVWNFKII